MSEILFTNLVDFKSCMNTITEEGGLLSKRGYELHKKYENIKSENYDFQELNNYNNIEIVAKKPNSNQYCFMYFVNNTSFLSKSYKTKSENNINNVEEKIKEVYELNPDEEIDITLVIVLTQLMKINNYILEKKIIEKIDIEKIQIFTYSNLLFNITKHSRIPLHIRVISDAKEKDNLCELKNIDSIDKLPKILLTDPLANFYGLCVGDIFEFKKYSKNSGIYIYYRVCV